MEVQVRAVCQKTVSKRPSVMVIAPGAAPRERKLLHDVHDLRVMRRECIIILRIYAHHGVGFLLSQSPPVLNLPLKKFLNDVHDLRARYKEAHYYSQILGGAP
jgi:hypothetical protein